MSVLRGPLFVVSCLLCCHSTPDISSGCCPLVQAASPSDRCGPPLHCLCYITPAALPHGTTTLRYNPEDLCVVLWKKTPPLLLHIFCCPIHVNPPPPPHVTPPTLSHFCCPALLHPSFYPIPPTALLLPHCSYPSPATPLLLPHPGHLPPPPSLSPLLPHPCYLTLVTLPLPPCSCYPTPD